MAFFYQNVFTGESVKIKAIKFTFYFEIECFFPRQWTSLLFEYGARFSLHARHKLTEFVEILRQIRP